MYLKRGEANGSRLLSAESLEAMETAFIDTPAQDSPFGQMGYGYGLHIVPDFLGQRLIGHGGSIGICTSYFGYLLAQNLGVAIVANGTGTPTINLSMVALAVALGKDPDALPFVQRERRLRELTGHYTTYKDTMKLTVKRSGDFLNVESRDHYTHVTVPLIPESIEEQRRTFYTLQNNSKLSAEFRVSESGEISLIYERYLLRKMGDLV
jgi:CubicO group peptidase (beta-lactamase class C family)